MSRVSRAFFGDKRDELLVASVGDALGMTSRKLRREIKALRQRVRELERKVG
jgi:hypothetical protein